MNAAPRIVFMGSPDFAVPSLQALARNYRVIGVVTQPDRPAGRSGMLSSPAVKQAALLMGIQVIQPEKIRLPEPMAILAAWAPDLIVVAAFGQILKANLLDLPPLGCINVHGSLLPRGRGAAPIQAAILAGDMETGITIMKMDAGVDTGPILSQRAIPIDPQDTADSLTHKLSALGADLLLETLPHYMRGKLVPKTQPEAGVTYAPMLKKEDGRLDFSQPALAVERRVRAMSPWPGGYFVFNGLPLKVLRASVIQTVTPGEGVRLVIEGFPALGCGEGILRLDEVQPAGKRGMPGKAFLSGARAWV